MYAVFQLNTSTGQLVFVQRFNTKPEAVAFAKAGTDRTVVKFLVDNDD